MQLVGYCQFDDSIPEADEVKRINLANMTNVIKEIALPVTSLVNGEDAPQRINTKKLN